MQRQAFTALVNFDLSVFSYPYLSKIGAALQSSNLDAAQHFGHEMQNRGGQLRTLASLILKFMYPTGACNLKTKGGTIASTTITCKS